LPVYEGLMWLQVPDSPGSLAYVIGLETPWAGCDEDVANVPQHTRVAEGLGARCTTPTKLENRAQFDKQ
jgi:hypothetical protein